MEDIKLDIQELTDLISKSERPNVKKYLESQLLVLKNKLESYKPIEKKEPQNNNHLANEISKKVVYTPITTYSFEDTPNICKIHISLTGVGSVEDKDLKMDLTDNSLAVKIENFNNKNLIFKIPELFNAININKSTIVKKNNYLIVKLYKQKEEKWTSLKKEESKLPKPKANDKDDPMGGLMNMMKEMYNNGDDNMKRTIAEAWTKAQSGKMDDKMKM